MSDPLTMRQRLLVWVILGTMLLLLGAGIYYENVGLAVAAIAMFVFIYAGGG